MEFCYSFWGIIGQDLFKVFEDSYKLKELPKSCQRAVISLLPKKGNLCLLKNWRPVAVLNSDYMILSKCIANCLKTVLGSLVHEDHS